MFENTHLKMVENDPPDVRKKTTRRFYKSDPSFLIKQAVVFTKVTRRFFLPFSRCRRIRFSVQKNLLFTFFESWISRNKCSNYTLNVTKCRARMMYFIIYSLLFCEIIF